MKPSSKRPDDDTNKRLQIVPVGASIENNQQVHNWVGIHIDNKYFLTSPSAFEKLQNLDRQISQEKNKLDKMTKREQGNPIEEDQDNRQKTAHQKQVKVRKNSFTSELSRECKTQINQFKALKARINAEKQLIEEEMRYQNKTIQLKKRRELKDATTFVIRNQKDQSFDASEKKKKASVKNFMMAPHQLASGKKKQVRDSSRVDSQQVSVPEKKEKVSLNYNTIEPKKTRLEQGALLSGGNTVKMTINSNERYNPNFQNTKSKQKSFIITSRKQFSSSSKEKESFLSGMREPNQKDKMSSKSEIDKLSTKLKQMQQKLLLVQKKQKELEQLEAQKKKKLEKSRQKISHQIKPTSKKNESIKESLGDKESKKQQDMKVVSVKQQELKNSIKKLQSIQLDKQEKNQQRSLFIREEKRLKKLNISSEIVAYNYKQDLQNKIKEEEQVNVKEKMSQEIDDLKRLIRQLKIDKIKQEAKIQELEHKDDIRKKNNFVETNNSQITFNGEDSKAVSSIKENNFSVKQSELSQDQIEVELDRNIQANRIFAKKQPRRILKLQTNHKAKIVKVESPFSAPSKNNSFQLKNNTNELSFNPEEYSKQQVSQNHDQNETIKKGKIIRQIINQDKFNTIDHKSEETIHHQEKEQKTQLKLHSKQSQPQEFGVRLSQIQMQEFERPEINLPQIQIIQGFPIPDLPSTPLLQTSQSQIISLAKKICEIFEIKVDGKEQLQFKKFKNCVVLRTPENSQAIVWHFSGKFYIGGWDQNKTTGEDHKQGQGFEFVPGKHYYRGEFANGKRNGHGTMICLDGDIYKGEWLNGQRHGKGVCLEKKSNSYYQGDWKEGKKTGIGILKVSEKQFYQGQFEKSVKSGSGLELFSNGDLYIGQYKNGKFDGKGKYFWSNGSAYIGSFVDGNREGQGKWISSQTEGDLYIGTYKKDKKEGRGKYIWNKGCSFEGQFKADLKHGEGRVQYQDGREVRGEWQYGRLKMIHKSSMEGQQNIFSQSSLQIEPRIRPNMPRIVETPSKQMQESKFIHGV